MATITDLAGRRRHRRLSADALERLLHDLYGPPDPAAPYGAPMGWHRSQGRVRVHGSPALVPAPQPANDHHDQDDNDDEEDDPS